MIRSIVKSVLGNEEKIVDKRSIEVFKNENSVVFKPNYSSDTNLRLVLDNEEYKIEDEMEFSMEYLESENAVLLASYRVCHRFGNEKSDKSVNIVISNEQIKDIRSIEINRESIAKTDNDFEIDVYEFDDSSILSLYNIHKNVPFRITLKFYGSKPELNINKLKPRNQYLDVPDIKDQLLLIQSDKKIRGKIIFNSEFISKDIKLDEIYEIGADQSIYCEESEIGDRIESWNDIDYELIIRPDNYKPIKRTIRSINGDTIIVNIKEEDLVETSTLIVKYPDWVVGIQPRLRHKNVDPHNKYPKKEKIGRNKYKFKRIFPNERTKLYHGGKFRKFENGAIPFSELNSAESKEVHLMLNPRYKGIKLESMHEKPVNFIIQDQSYQISNDKSKTVTIDLNDIDESISIRCKSHDNNDIDDREISKDDLKNTRKIKIIDDCMVIKKG